MGGSAASRRRPSELASYSCRPHIVGVIRVIEDHPALRARITPDHTGDRAEAARTRGADDHPYIRLICARRVGADRVPERAANRRPARVPDRRFHAWLLARPHERASFRKPQRNLGGVGSFERDEVVAAVGPHFFSALEWEESSIP